MNPLPSPKRALIPIAVLAVGLATGPLWADDGAARSRPGASSSSSATASSGSSSRSSVSRSSSGSAQSTRPTSSSSHRQPVRTSDRRRGDYRRDHRYYYYGDWYRGGWYPVGYGAFWWGGWGWWGPPDIVIYDPGAYQGRYRDDAGWGALDTDVYPEEAEVWVDGERLGIADNFDGFPEYLWLPEGDHEVVIYHPGYRTIHREYTLRPGVVIEVDDDMDRGESVSPMDLFDQDTPRRDARVERDRLRRERVDRARADATWRQRDDSSTAQPSSGSGDDWRDRDARAPRAVPVGEGEARVRLTVVPPDASLYLDGSFLGIAEEWREFLVEPGEYRLDVVRPGYESTSRDLDLEANEMLDLSIELDED